MTRKVVASFAESESAKKDREMIGVKSAKELEPSVLEALDKVSLFGREPVLLVFAFARVSHQVVLT